MKLTQKRLKELLDYDPKTGVFTNRVQRGQRALVGEVVGGEDARGYLQAVIDSRNYTLHRLAFLYMEGYLPEQEVDHLNGVRTDNVWKNLRHVSTACNMQNCKVRQSNKSGFPGVSWNKVRKGWTAQIMVSGKQVFLGVYKCKLEAALARLTFEVNSPKWTCNFRGELVKAVKDAWPAFNPRSIE